MAALVGGNAAILRHEIKASLEELRRRNRDAWLMQHLVAGVADQVGRPVAEGAVAGQNSSLGRA